MVWNKLDRCDAVRKLHKRISIIPIKFQSSDLLHEFAELLLPPHKATMPAELRIEVDKSVLRLVELLVKVGKKASPKLRHMSFAPVICVAKSAGFKSKMMKSARSRSPAYGTGKRERVEPVVVT